MSEIENDHLLRKDTLYLRDALCEFLEEKYGKIRFLEEKKLGKIRADLLAVLPDGILGIEIKSHSDTYARLSEQVKGYNKFCDLCFLAAGDRHAHAEEHIPAEWGLVSISVHMGASFEIAREARKGKRDPLKNQLSLLWKNELAHILATEKLPKYAGKSKKFICEKLLERIPPDRLKMLLCEALFERDYTKYQENE